MIPMHPIRVCVCTRTGSVCVDEYIMLIGIGFNIRYFIFQKNKNARLPREERE